MSSDSGSTTNFRAFEDGYKPLLYLHQLANTWYSFAAYAASKAALNQALRVGTPDSFLSRLFTLVFTADTGTAFSGRTKPQRQWNDDIGHASR